MMTVVFAFTSCESESKVTEVCEDLIKASMHKTARSLEQVDTEQQKLTISEYEFLGGINDDRMVYRTITFGNGIYEKKQVDTLSYLYGDWNDAKTAFSLFITPSTGDPYTLWYEGNAFITPDGREIGGEGLDNTPRVEKWEKVIASFRNTSWEGVFKDEFVMDSIFRDSIRTTYIPPATFIYDTIKVFTGKMDTLSADTASYYTLTFNYDAGTLENTGRYVRTDVRTTYDRATQTTTTVSEKSDVYDFTWFFSDVSSDTRFVVTLVSTTSGKEGEDLSISKYKTDDEGVATGFLLGGLTFTQP